MDPTLAAALLTLSLAAPAATTPSPLPPLAVVHPHPVGSSLQVVIDRDSRRWSQLMVARAGVRRADGSQAQRKNWIRRHPSCFGAAVGFVGGFLIGFLPGDDAVFDDFTAAFNGAVLGGIGAGTGAILGWLATRP